jgi:hypothetical protein
MRESFSENDHKWIDWPFGTVRGEMPASGYVASKFHLGADLPLELDGVWHDARGLSPMELDCNRQKHCGRKGGGGPIPIQRIFCDD